MNIALKPFYFCSFIYLFSNVIFFTIALTSNTMRIEFMEFYIETSVLCEALLLQIFVISILFIFYNSFSKKKYREDYIFDNRYGYFLIFWQFLFFYFALFFGLGVVGSDEIVNPNLVRLSNFISADMLYLIIAPSLKSRKIYLLNTILYIVSTVSRGWLGGILIAFFIYLCRKKALYVSIKSLSLVFFLIIFLFLISPFLIDLKFMIRTGESIVFDTTNYGAKLELASNYLLGRFQHVGHTALLINHAELYRKLYENYNILPFWLEGVIQNFVYKLLGNDRVFTFSQNFAIWDFNASTAEPWYSNTGISGWLVILKEKSIVFFIYWIGIISLLYSFLLKYANRQTFNMISVFMIVYLYHGWLGSFFNLMFLTLLVVTIKRVKF